MTNLGSRGGAKLKPFVKFVLLLLRNKICDNQVFISISLVHKIMANRSCWGMRKAPADCGC